MNIDWSKTSMRAIGAMVANFNHPDGRGKIEFLYSPADRGRYREGPASWEYIHAPEEAALQPWTGDGLPPVGTVCEFAGFNPEETLPTDPRVGDQVTVIAHFKSGSIDVAAFTFYAAPEFKYLQVAQGAYGCFRPIRTAEQIAAEEREKAVDEMFDIWSQADGSRQAFATIYDIGYRKQVQP